MIQGERVHLRPISENDWPLFEKWGRERNALWGPYQRFQLDHLPILKEAYRQTGLLSRESGMLLIEEIGNGGVVGFVRYTLLPFPDVDFPQPEIGFGITEIDARGKGLAKEAVKLLLDYLFAGYAAERISAITDEQNQPAQKLLEALGFQREGLLRRASYRDGRWRDMAFYGLLRED